MKRVANLRYMYICIDGFFAEKRQSQPKVDLNSRKASASKRKPAAARCPSPVQDYMYDPRVCISHRFFLRPPTLVFIMQYHPLPTPNIYIVCDE